VILRSVDTALGLGQTVRKPPPPSACECTGRTTLVEGADPEGLRTGTNRRDLAPGGQRWPSDRFPELCALDFRSQLFPHVGVLRSLPQQ